LCGWPCRKAFPQRCGVVLTGREHDVAVLDGTPCLPACRLPACPCKSHCHSLEMRNATEVMDSWNKKKRMKTCRARQGTERCREGALAE